MERSERIGATQDRHGKTEQLPSPDQCSSKRSMRVRARTRDSRSLLIPMHQMDAFPYGDAPMYNKTQKQLVFLSGRKTNGGWQVLDSRSESGSDDDTIRTGNRTT